MNKPSPTALAQILTLRTATAIVIGSIIGSGIFKKTSAMCEALPSPILVLCVWFFAGIITFLGGLCAAEISSAFPESGGLYAHLRRILGRFVGFLYGWSVIAVIQTGSIASIAYVFAQYLSYIFPLGDVNVDVEGWVFLGTIDIEPFRDLSIKLVAVLAILCLTIINIVGVVFGALVQDIVTLLKVIIVVFIVVIAGFGDGNMNNILGSNIFPPDSFPVFSGFILALSGAFWAYDGWINVTYIGAEMKNPKRDTTYALGLGLFVVTILYMLVNIAYFYLLPLSEIRESEMVAADALSKVMPFGAVAASAFVALSCLGTTNGTILSSARVIFAMGRDNVLPRIFGAIHPRFTTPHLALILQGVWASVLIFSGTFDQITDMLIFVSWGFYGLLALAVIIARIRFPKIERPFRVPLYPIIPVIFIIFCMIYLVVSVVENQRNALLGTFLVMTGLPIWVWYSWKERGVNGS